MLTISSLTVDACCVLERHILASSSVIQLTASNISSRYLLFTPGDEAARVVSQRGVVMFLNGKVSAAFSGKVPVDSRPCAVRLQGSVGVRKDTLVKCSLFINSLLAQEMVAPTQNEEL